MIRHRYTHHSLSLLIYIMIISSIDEPNTLASSLIDQWKHKFLLEGDLWVGKTQFVKWIMKALWSDPIQVQSPTYTYMNIYPLISQKSQLLHMDLYRFESQENAFNKWIFEAIDEHDYICIERPRRETEYTDTSRTRIVFSFNTDGTGTLEIT